MLKCFGWLIGSQKVVLLEGAKKKKNEEIVRATGVTGPYELINIFKNRKDPEIKPLSEYPSWLAELLYNQHNYNEYLVDAYKGYDVRCLPDYSS